MQIGLLYKPSHDEWLHCAQVVVERLTTCVHVYTRPPFEDVFMADKERQKANAVALDLLRRVYALTDESDTPTDSLADVAYHDERVIAGLNVLMGEVLDHLPKISADMQKLLKSPWFEDCNGRLAGELFRGPMGNLPEGIGSGHPEHGRLPEAVRDLMEREVVGEVRQPRKALHRPSLGRSTYVGKGPSRSDEGDVAARRRWADTNSGYLRSAGRVE